MKRFFLLLILSFGIMKEINAQCGTKSPTRDHLQGKVLPNSRIATATFRFKIFVTILKNTDGSNAACTEADIMAKITEMNADFAPTFCFNLMGIKYVNNTNLNTDMNVGSSSDISSLTANNEGGCVDIFVHKALRDGSNTSVTGSAYAIPNQYLSIENVGNHILSHEMGHCLGLSHTHETVDGTELVNGSNCGAAGDHVCDTNADPNVTRVCRTESACLYTGYCSDALGYLYSPPVTNIMSYYGCVTTFTAGQITRMYSTVLLDLGTFAGNLIVSGDDHYPGTIISNTTISSGIANYATGGIMTFGWGSSVTGTFVITPTGSLNAQANQIVLLPGFRATGGTTGKVRFKTLTCN
jgi:hypothetical protein